ncbi:MAG: alpha/beta hydrolase [Anaerolineae bacterium]
MTTGRTSPCLDWRRDVAALVRAQGKPAHLVGLSLGGAVALQLAVTAPELVRNLTVTGAQYAPGKGYGGTLLGRVIKGVFRLIPERLLLRTLLRALVTIYPASEEARAEVYRVGRAGFVAAIDALTAIDLSAQLPKIRIPTLVLVGALDQPGLRQEAQEIALAIPKG